MKWLINQKPGTHQKSGNRRTIEADGFDFNSDSEAYVFFSLEEGKGRKVCVIPRTEVLSIVEEAQA